MLGTKGFLHLKLSVTGKRWGRGPVGAVLRWLLLSLYTLFLLAPLYWVVVTSIKPTDDYLRTPPVWFPGKPTSIHYGTALNQMRGWRAIENSLVVASLVTIASVVTGALAGYSMARFRTGGPGRFQEFVVQP